MPPFSRNLTILQDRTNIFRRSTLCKFRKGPLPWHIYKMIGRIHLRFLPLCKQGKQKGNNRLSKKRTMLTFNTLLLFSLAFISIRFKQIWASCIIVMVCDGFLSLSGKTGCSVKLCGKGVKLMFSFVSSAKPGKHFLIQTEDEDGQLENGSVLNKNAGTDTCKLLFFKTCFLFVRLCAGTDT